jgi:uncharacterized protein YdaU (DUF1376 family)
MAENPALPLWTDALLGDTQHLTQAEFGAYLLMLIVAWRSKDCALPNDDRFLAKITRSDRNWQRIKPNVIKFWTLCPDGQLRQKRLTYEYLAAQELKRQRSEAGKSSALKRKERLMTSVDAAMKQGGNENPTSNPNPLSIPKEDPDNTASLDAAPRIPGAHERYGEVANRVLEITGGKTLYLNRVDAWLKAGADPELDIYPAIKRKLPEWRSGSLVFFDGAVSDALKSRTAPLPAGQARFSQPSGIANVRALLAKERAAE